MAKKKEIEKVQNKEVAKVNCKRNQLLTPS